MNGFARLAKYTSFVMVAAVATNNACLTQAMYKVDADSGNTKLSNIMMYDFRKIQSLDNWIESSDTVREPGKSKGAFVIQKSKLFQRAVFFSMLNPQPNGAGFVGFYTSDGWSLDGMKGLEMLVRGQGENQYYKLNLRHHGDDSEKPTYEAFFHIPSNEWTTVKLEFSQFKPYYRGRPVPDAAPLDVVDITHIGLQIVGGVYSDFKQSGTSSLEIDYIQSYQ